VREPALRVLIADGQRTLKVHEGGAVDARTRRIAVHQRREHEQAIAVLLDVERHPRLLARADLRQRLRAHVDVDARGERRQRLADQLRKRGARDGERLRQLLEPRAGEVDGADGAQHVVGGADHAERDHLAHAAVRLDAHAHTAVRVLDDRARHHRISAGRDLLVVDLRTAFGADAHPTVAGLAPPHVTRVGEHGEQAIELVAGERSGAPEQLIGGQVGLDRRDVRGLALADQRQERVGELLGAIAADQQALDDDAAGLGAQHVADRRRGDRRLGQLATGALGREHGGDDVRAHGFLAPARALPLQVLGLEDDFERGGAARDADLELELAPALGQAVDPSVAGERHPLRPGAFGRLGANRVAELGQHGDPRGLA